LENYNPVRKINSNVDGNRDYIDYQNCWASFKCPSGMLAYWRILNLLTEDNYDQVLFYGVNNYQSRVYQGELRDSQSNYYQTLWDNEITFEFKADESNHFEGFEILLKCE